MGIINRFLLFLYTLFTALLSLGMILLVARVIPEQYVINEYQYLTAQWQTGAGALVFFLLSVHLLFCCFPSKKHDTVRYDEYIVVDSNKGSVQVTLNAIKDMVGRISQEIIGVREVNVACQVRHSKENVNKLELSLNLVLGQERSVSSISDNIREKVADYMNNVVGISDYKMDIEVRGIVNTVAANKKRKIN